MTLESQIQTFEGGSPLAKNPNTTASGQYQFIKSSWQQAMKNVGLPLDTPTSDPKANALAIKDSIFNNGIQLTKALGRPPTFGELGMAHVLGPQGAIDFLKNKANTPSSQVVSENVYKFNPKVFKNKDGSERTVQEVHDMFNKTFTDESKNTQMASNDTPMDQTPVEHQDPPSVTEETLTSNEPTVETSPEVKTAPAIQQEQPEETPVQVASREASDNYDPNKDPDDLETPDEDDFNLVDFSPTAENASEQVNTIQPLMRKPMKSQQPKLSVPMMQMAKISGAAHTGAQHLSSGGMTEQHKAVQRILGRDMHEVEAHALLHHASNDIHGQDDLEQAAKEFSKLSLNENHDNPEMIKQGRQEFDRHMDNFEAKHGKDKANYVKNLMGVHSKAALIHKSGGGLFDGISNTVLSPIAGPSFGGPLETTFMPKWFTDPTGANTSIDKSLGMAPPEDHAAGGQVGDGDPAADGGADPAQMAKQLFAQSQTNVQPAPAARMTPIQLPGGSGNPSTQITPTQAFTQNAQPVIGRPLPTAQQPPLAQPQPMTGNGIQGLGNDPNSNLIRAELTGAPLSQINQLNYQAGQPSTPNNYNGYQPNLGPLGGAPLQQMPVQDITSYINNAKEQAKQGNIPTFNMNIPPPPPPIDPNAVDPNTVDPNALSPSELATLKAQADAAALRQNSSDKTGGRIGSLINKRNSK